MEVRRHRQLNVRQQNDQAQADIRREALYWREHPAPEALRTCARERGVDLERSLILLLDIDSPGMGGLFGLLVTPDERFIEFFIDTEQPYQLANIVENWEDVSGAQNMSLRNRGTGAGRGALAVKVLRELNAAPRTTI